jgi:hypothetical protein
MDECSSLNGHKLIAADLFVDTDGWGGGGGLAQCDIAAEFDYISFVIQGILVI